MKWIYGKQDSKTLERGQENCYLLTNGLGGYSSLTMIGSAARNDRAFLMASAKAPNHRYNMVHRLSECLETGQEAVQTFPLGGYYLTYLKVHSYSKEAKHTVNTQLEVMESAMREGCIGQLPEIYGGRNPASSRGCFAQAWSMGELLRVLDALRSIP